VNFVLDHQVVCLEVAWWQVIIIRYNTITNQKSHHTIPVEQLAIRPLLLKLYLSKR
jgi:hypothetical protein